MPEFLVRCQGGGGGGGGTQIFKIEKKISKRIIPQFHIYPHIFCYYISLEAFVLEAISFGRVMVPSLNIDINLPRTHVKLQCEGEPFQFNS